MQIVINISENHYKTLQMMHECGLGYYHQAIINGTVLPKGHGRLIDADALGKSLEKEQEDLDLDDKLSNAFSDGLTWASEVLSKEPTIIEADKGEE